MSFYYLYFGCWSCEILFRLIWLRATCVIFIHHHDFAWVSTVWRVSTKRCTIITWVSTISYNMSQHNNIGADSCHDCAPFCTDSSYCADSCKVMVVYKNEACCSQPYQSEKNFTRSTSKIKVIKRTFSKCGRLFWFLGFLVKRKFWTKLF